MKIVKDTVVTLHYEMYDGEGKLIDKTEEPISYLHGGYDGIFPLVEEALHEKEIGSVVEVTLQPEDAFGEPDSELIRMEDLKYFPVDVEIGMTFETDDPETDDVLEFRVVDIADSKAVIDGNHPLAGVKICFKSTITEIRAASAEEIKHGHAHGAHGHHH